MMNESDAIDEDEKTLVLKIKGYFDGDDQRTRKTNDMLIELAATRGTVDAYVDPAALLRSIRPAVVHQEKIIRSQMFRTLRKLCKTSQFCAAIIETKIDVFICKAMEAKKDAVWERMQSLKLLRQMMDVDPVCINRALVMSLISIATYADDEFRKVCLDTLRELAVVNPAIVSSSHGIKALVEGILDPKCEDAAMQLTLTMLYLMDQPDSRRYIQLQPNYDLLPLFSVFSNTDAGDHPPQEQEDAKQAAANAIVTMMRSWTGILVLSSEEFGLRSLINAMALPEAVKGSSWARRAISDLLFELLETGKSHCITPGARTNLLSNYIVVFLLALIRCGIIETLTSIAIEGTNTEAQSMAKSMLSELFILSSDILPPEMNTKLNTLPEVMKLATAFDANHQGTVRRIQACNMLDELAEHSIKASASGSGEQTVDGLLTMETLVNVTDLNSNFRRYHRFADTRRKEHMVKSLRVHLEEGLQEQDLLTMSKATNVEKTKDIEKWNFKDIVGILEGPLQNTSHLAFLNGKTKFIKRLCSFLKPSKQGFCKLAWGAAHAYHMATAALLFRVMTQGAECTDGNFIDMISEIVHGIADLVRKPSKPAPFLTRDAVTQTLSREYFTLLGILSETASGLLMLRKLRFFDVIAPICGEPSLDYITRLLASNLDYGLPVLELSKARPVLLNWMLNGSTPLKRCIVNHVRLVLRSNVEGLRDWGLEVLVTGLSTTRNIALLALRVLEEVCVHKEDLIELLKKNPSFDLVMKEASESLFIRFLGLQDGFEYLGHLNWIEPNVELWASKLCLNYVQELEGALVGALNENVSTRRFAEFDSLAHDEAYLFDRLHAMPWRVSLLIQRGDGSEFPLAMDSFVDTRVNPITGSLDVFVSSLATNKSTAALRFNRIGARTQLTATLSIGKQERIFAVSKEQWHKVLHESDRQNMDERLVVKQENVLWHFEHDKEAENSDGERQPVLRLARVQFFLSMLSSTVTRVVLPPHLYGALAQTRAGRQLITSCALGSLEENIHNIKDDTLDPILRRAAMWTIGQVGATEPGFRLIQPTGIVEYLGDFCLHCPTLSFRGTAFYIVGLFAATKLGRTFLAGLNWSFPLDPTLAIAIPQDLDTFFRIPLQQSHESWTTDKRNRIGVSSVPSTTDKRPTPINDSNFVALILGHISNLGNNVTQKYSHMQLKKLRSRTPKYFMHPGVFLEAAKLMSSYSFHLPARRFIWFDLFDKVEFDPVAFDAFDHTSMLSTDEPLSYFKSIGLH